MKEGLQSDTYLKDLLGRLNLGAAAAPQAAETSLPGSVQNPAPDFYFKTEGVDLSTPPQSPVIPGIIGRLDDPELVIKRLQQKLAERTAMIATLEQANANKDAQLAQQAGMITALQKESADKSAYIVEQDRARLSATTFVTHADVVNMQQRQPVFLGERDMEMLVNPGQSQNGANRSTFQTPVIFNGKVYYPGAGGNNIHQVGR